MNNVPTLALMRALWRVNHSLERVSKRMQDDLGVTAQQRMMIRWVGKMPRITAGQLAAQLHVDAGTVSAAAGRLERRGLLRRRRDAADRRRVMLELTPAGHALDRPTRGTVESAVQRLLSAARPADVRVADRVLRALCDALDLEVARPRRAVHPQRRREP